MYCIIFSFITLLRRILLLDYVVGLKNNNRKAEKIMDTPAIRSIKIQNRTYILKYNLECMISYLI